MTREEALAKAKEMFGEGADALTIIDGIAEITGVGLVGRVFSDRPDRDGNVFGIEATVSKKHHVVGVWPLFTFDLPMKLKVMGQGESWEAAFADAESHGAASEPQT